MRLGGPFFGESGDPASWAEGVNQKGYRAAYCPVSASAGDDLIRAYATAAHNADLVIAEVGAWSNPISPNEEIRSAALRHCQEQLDLADRIGARCCVNIAGSRGEQWDGPHPDNLSEETFDLVVESVRNILDAVKPSRTFYTLETMPWVFPESPESYARLVAAVDRPAFGVHLDPVNLISSPQKFYDNATLIRECFRLLGPHIKSCHAKDIALSGRLTLHLDEVRPGLGVLDFRVFLHELNRLDPNTPVMLEHLVTEEEYDLAAEYLHTLALEENISIR
jgi:sugar phosphate isomerase/epimerase